jgi:hypothetical protein
VILMPLVWPRREPVDFTFNAKSTAAGGEVLVANRTAWLNGPVTNPNATQRWLLLGLISFARRTLLTSR